MAEVKPTITVKFLIDGQEVGMLLLSPKEFSTGSTGYFASGKITLGDEAEKGYQVQVQMVKIGSKKIQTLGGIGGQSKLVKINLVVGRRPIKRLNCAGVLFCLPSCPRKRLCIGADQANACFISPECGVQLLGEGLAKCDRSPLRPVGTLRNNCVGATRLLQCPQQSWHSGK